MFYLLTRIDMKLKVGNLVDSEMKKLNIVAMVRICKTSYLILLLLWVDMYYIGLKSKMLLYLLEFVFITVSLNNCENIYFL